ncbi:MAG: hypothetical protein ACYDIE_01900 [Candidatus Krumholzibacteriia bacterium]
MKTRPGLLCLLVVVAASPLLQVRSSQAVPAFARREGAPCQMCHFRLPELNEDGHAYLRRGLREERGDMPSHMGMAMGAQASADAPVASTARPLGEALPLEWRNYLTVMGHHTFEARRYEKAAFRSGGLDGWIGGPLDQHWSGVANFAFDIEAGGVDVEQAYAQFNTSWSARFASLRYGQLLPFAILFNGSGAAMPLSAPVILETPSRERNPWAPAVLLRGVEIGLVDLPKWNVYAGAGQPRLDEFVSARHTDFYASAEYLIGGTDNALSVFGYKGEIAAAAGQPSLDYDRALLFANVYGPGLKGVLGLLWGRDRPLGERSLDTTGGFLLGELLLAERWAGYARYDYARREVPVGDAETTDGPTIGVSCWAQTQVRLTLESRFLKSAGASRDRSAIAEILWVF